MNTAQQIHRLQKMTPLERTQALHAMPTADIAALCLDLRMPARLFTQVTTRIIWLNDQIATRPLSDLLPSTKKTFVSDRERRAALITRGSTEPVDQFVATVAANLQTLAQQAPTKQFTRLHIAPPRPPLAELLAKASTTAKPFTRHTAA